MKVTVDTHQSWDIWLWYLILLTVALTYYFSHIGSNMMILSIIGLIVFFILMIVNSSVAVNKIKNKKV